MIFGLTHDEFKEWRPVFAWLPHMIEDGRWAWLQTIERRPRRTPFRFSWEYRLPERGAA